MGNSGERERKTHLTANVVWSNSSHFFVLFPRSHSRYSRIALDTLLVRLFIPFGVVVDTPTILIFIRMRCSLGFRVLYDSGCLLSSLLSALVRFWILELARRFAELLRRRKRKENSQAWYFLVISEFLTREWNQRGCGDAIRLLLSPATKSYPNTMSQERDVFSLFLSPLQLYFLFFRFVFSVFRLHLILFLHSTWRFNYAAQIGARRAIENGFPVTESWADRITSTALKV